MKGKVILFFFLILLSVLLFTGCSESFTYTYYTDKNGGIHYEYLFTYDAESEDAESVVSAAYSVAKKYVMANDLSEYATIDAETPGRIALFIDFSDQTEQMIYQGLTGKEKPEKSEDAKEKGILLYRDYSMDPYTSLSTLFRSYLGEAGQALPDPTNLYFVYGTPFSSVRSNADHIEKSDGLYYHTWYAQPGKPLNVVLRSYGLNAVYLYLGGIALFVLSIVVLFVIIGITNKKNRRRFSVATPMSGVGATPVNDETEDVDDLFDLRKGE